MKKPEYLVALTVIAGAIILVVAMSYAIGKLNFGATPRELRLAFQSIDGITINSDVRYAGAPVGLVRAIRVMNPRQQRDLEGLRIPGTSTGRPLAIELTVTLPQDLELFEGTVFTISQDTPLSPKYIALEPRRFEGKSLDLARVYVGKQPAGLEDLVKTAEDTLSKASAALDKAEGTLGKVDTALDDLMPTVRELNSIATRVNEALPNIMVSLDALLDDGDALISSLNTPENLNRIQELLANLNVVTANFKVVSSNAKALTLTLAETPWRLLWGGKTNPPPPEKEVLKSNQPVPVRNVIEVNAPRGE
jgi:ABC-type transporter Mla subunit MlaD